MATVFQFAYPLQFLIGIVAIVVAIFIRSRFFRPTSYLYPLTHFIKEHGLAGSTFCTKFFFWIRCIILFILVLLIGRPQIVDSRSKTIVEGIDIVLALDMSGSMELFDDESDRRSRLEIAKREALSFIDKRQNDAIGLVIFGAYAIALCPTTQDKNILKSLIAELAIGQPSSEMPNGTVIARGLVAALRRLQTSKSTSKVIILLTDGMPSSNDIDYKQAISIANKIGVKIYTIGIGSPEGGLFQHPFFGLHRASCPLNKPLLEDIALLTGGKFFEAKKPQDLKTIYNTIDKLEKQSYETELYNKYHDYFMPFLWCAVLLIICELFVATWIWFIL